jgi:hypothetical protein
MTKSAHIADLVRLEDEVDEAMLHESVNPLMIVDLKHRQLQLREEINFLRREPSIPNEPDTLLCCRMAMLGLDPSVIEAGDPEAFATIKRRCKRCEFREACTADLKRDPNNPVWESYCPNSGALNTLSEIWWVSNAV